MPPHVRSGLDVLQSQAFHCLRSLRVGLVAHPASVTCRLQHAADLLADAPSVRLAALFGPEHGWHGTAQDLVGVAGQQADGLKIHSLYGDSFDSLKPTSKQLEGLDALVIDLQDIGSRYYTFQATMLLCLEAAASQGLLTVVLDRPNPLGGLTVEGPTLQRRFESFVGMHPVAIRHGLTIGELAMLYRHERNIHGGELLVIRCEGWERKHYFDQTGLPWVMPSPNMSALDTALVYPGMCLLEGTNLSEGRGTTRPFELCGAPWIDARRAAREMMEQHLPGVVFRPASFQPTFHKFTGQTCGGVQLHVTDRDVFQPVRTGLAVLDVLRKLSGLHFRWRTEPYEFVTHIPAIDLLFGSDRERLALEAGQGWRSIAETWREEEEAFRFRRDKYFLY